MTKIYFSYTVSAPLQTFWLTAPQILRISLAPRVIQVSFEGWNLQSHPLTSGEEAASGGRVQSPTSHYLIDHVYIWSFHQNPKNGVWRASRFEDTQGRWENRAPRLSSLTWPWVSLHLVDPELYPFILNDGLGK